MRRFLAGMFVIAVTWSPVSAQSPAVEAQATPADATDSYPLFDMAVDGASGSRAVELPEGKGYLTVQPCDPFTMFLAVLKRAQD